MKDSISGGLRSANAPVICNESDNAMGTILFPFMSVARLFSIEMNDVFGVVSSSYISSCLIASRSFKVMLIVIDVEASVETIPSVSVYVKLVLLVFAWGAKVMAFGSMDEAFTVSEKRSSTIRLLEPKARYKLKS